MKYIKDTFKAAIKTGNLPLVKEYIESGTNPETENNFALFTAAKNNYVELFEYLLSVGADPTVDDNIIIETVAKLGNFNIFDILINDSRVNPFGDANNSPLREAIIHNHPYISLKLLKLGADPRNVNRIYQLVAAKGQLTVLTELLKDDRIDPSLYNNLPIRLASRNGKIDCLMILAKDERVNRNMFMDNQLAPNRQMRAEDVYRLKKLYPEEYNRFQIQRSANKFNL